MDCNLKLKIYVRDTHAVRILTDINKACLLELSELNWKLGREMYRTAGSAGITSVLSTKENRAVLLHAVIFSNRLNFQFYQFQNQALFPSVLN